MKKIYTLSLLLFSICSLFAQKVNIFDVFYDENRLNALKVSNDTLWVGSSSSLVKRLLPDGKVLEVWDGNNSPLNKPITDIAVSINGQIALAHQILGLTLKKGNQWKAWSAEAIFGSTPGALVLRVGFDKNNRLWVIGRDQLMYLENEQWVKHKDLGFSVERFLNDASGNLFWMNSMLVSGYVDGKLKTYSLANSSPIPIFNDFFCNAGFAPNGHLYVFTSKGSLYHFTNTSTYSKITLPNDFIPTSQCSFVRFLINDIGNITLISSKKIYQRKINGESKIKDIPSDWFPSSFISERIMADDKYGNIWQASNPSNILQKITDDNLRIDAPLSGFVWCSNLSMESSGLYFWCYDKGYLIRYHINDRSKDEYYLSDNQNYTSFAPTGKPNQMWIANFDGLQLYDNGQFSKINEDVASEDKRMFYILTLKDGRVMGSGQLNKKSVVKIYDPRSSTWAYHEYGKNGLPNYFYLIHSKDPKGDVWFTYDNGILNYKNNAWDSIRFEDTRLSLKHPVILSVTADGDIWTTNFDTIYRFDQHKWTMNHVLECPLLGSTSSSGIHNLFTDSKGRLWASGGCNEPRLSMYNGLQWYHLDTTNSNIPKGTFLSKIVEDIHGNLWILANPMVRLRTKDFEVWQQKQQEGQLHVWPNPATSGFTVNLPKNAFNYIELMDVQGRILLRKKILHNGEDVFFERGSLPNGLYFVRLQSLSGRVYVQKVILH